MTLDYDDFRARRYFGALDGVRAISVIIVLIFHMPEKRVWSWLNGYLGVNSFFILSGFLITTLCIREMHASEERLSLIGFYVRRVFRILPLYLITLLLYVILTALNTISTWSSMESHIGYYLAMSGDLARFSGPFRHSWSLGIEEKFYLLWPIVLISLRNLSNRQRAAITFALLAASMVTGMQVVYVSLYVGILSGCLLAVVLDDRSLFGYARRFAASTPAVAAVASVAAVLHFGRDAIAHSGAVYAVVVAAVLGAILLRDEGVVAVSLRSRPMRWIGRRSYGIYLLHPIMIYVVGLLIAPSNSNALTIGTRLVLAFGLSFAVADIAHRTVEVPMIRRGHRLSQQVARHRLAAAHG